MINGYITFFKFYRMQKSTNLASKLITWKSEYSQPFGLSKLVVQSLQFLIVDVSLASFRGNIDDDACVIPAKTQNITFIDTDYSVCFRRPKKPYTSGPRITRIVQIDRVTFNWRFV